MFWSLKEAQKEIERLKAELEEAKAEIERLNKQIAEDGAENMGAFIDEFINGPKDDRMEVQPWAMSK